LTRIDQSTFGILTTKSQRIKLCFIRKKRLRDFQKLARHTMSDVLCLRAMRLRDKIRATKSQAVTSVLNTLF